MLADGRLALIGQYNGIDGTTSVAAWNPVDNSLTVFGPYQGHGIEPCGFFGTFAGFSRTVDRTRILLGTYGADMCALDPSTGNYVTSAGDMNGTEIFPTPDGRYIVVPSLYPYNGAAVLDSQTLETITEFPVMGDVGTDAAFVISADSSTLFTPSLYGSIYAYSIPSGQPQGWLSNLYLPSLSGGTDFGPPFAPNLQATDGSGLFAGPMEEGVGFVDLSVLNPLPVGSQFVNAELTPATGPASGGTAVQWGSPGVKGSVTSVYFGPQQATAVSYSSENIHATSPPGAAGPADIYAFVSDGGLQVIPEGFSYGPTILEVTPNMSTAEGSGRIHLRLRLGPTTSNMIPSGLRSP